MKTDNKTRGRFNSTDFTVKMEKRLIDMSDARMAEFQSKLMPTVEPDTVLGIKTPELKEFAKGLAKEYGVDKVKLFMTALPHKYFEENQVHAFLISEIKDFDECVEELDRFLPFVNNWATCDQMSPKIFAKCVKTKKGKAGADLNRDSDKEKLLKCIDRWLASKDTYAVRFALSMLMKHFLDESFDGKYLEKAAAIRTDEYYIKMMVAWYFQVALVKQYDSAIPYLKEGKLDAWTHNKTIQKAVESFRMTEEQKKELKLLKRI